MALPIHKAAQTVHVDSFVSVLLQATEEEQAAGMAWYEVYHNRIVSRGSEIGLSAEVSCALFATLSPQRHIRRNWALYDLLLNTLDAWSMPIMDPEKYKLAGLLGCGDLVQYLSGRKVTNFYRNLMLDYTGVTVDRHAASAVYGTVIFNSIADAQYTYCEKVVKTAATMADIPPAQAQAVAWVVWRRLKGIVD